MNPLSECFFLRTSSHKHGVTYTEFAKLFRHERLFEERLKAFLTLWCRRRLEPRKQLAAKLFVGDDLRRRTCFF